MNRYEVMQWVAYHDSLFPGYGQWFQAGDESAINIRIDAWGRRLGQFSLDHVQRASNALFESREKPRYHSEHLDWICNHLRPRPLLNDCGLVVALQKCRLCNDTGMVTVIFHQQQFTPRGIPLPGNTGAAACKCSKGQWLNEHRGDARLHPYDARYMDLPQPPRLTDAEREQITIRIRTRRPALADALVKLIRRTD